MGYCKKSEGVKLLLQRPIMAFLPFMLTGATMHSSQTPPLFVRPLIALLSLAFAGTLAQAAPVADVHALAQKEQQPLLDTLRDLVHIESGSKDIEGLNQIAALIAGQLKAQGGTVEILQPTDIYRLDDTPEKVGPAVHAEFKGTGTKKILFIAHMDTVYLKGMLKDQPFRIDGGKAYGLGIADDKQGVATILHTVGLLQKLGFNEYGTLTVLINGDEEISSPGARSTITASRPTRMRCFPSRAAARTAACAWPPAVSARPTWRCRAGPRTPVPRPKRA